VKCPHRVVVSRRERDMDLPIGSHPGTLGDPESRLTVPPVSDGLAEIHLPRITQHARQPVVEHLRFGVVSAIDSKVIDHQRRCSSSLRSASSPARTGLILASATDTVVDYLDLIRVP
jgi:hypothetical protein